MNIFQKLKLLSAAVILTLPVLSINPAYAAFNNDLLISDSIFDRKFSMSAAQIDAFLNARPHSCISTNRGFAAIQPTGYNPTDGFTYGGYVSAGTIIYSAAQAYDLNPQVLIVTLEKEQSLVTGRNDFNGYCNASSQHKYAAAMGYGCPDSGGSYSYTGVSLYRRNGVTVSSTGSTCVNSSTKAGFSQQIIRAAWLLKFAQQRSRGNIGWAIIRGSWDNSDDPQSCYSGPMTRGTFQVCPSGPSVYYDGYRTIDGTTTFMGSGATAALYWYTPHFHGNQNFVALFESWFGSTTLPCGDGTNDTDESSGKKIVANEQGKGVNASLSFVRLNNTGSKCAEVHTWNRGFGSWASNIMTNLSSSNPANKSVISGDMNGDGKDELMYVKYQSGSGWVEVHTWNYQFNAWADNTATNLPNITNPSNGTILTGDMNGDGKDELMYVKYQSGSGWVEVHTWNPGYKSWASHLITNVKGVDPNYGRIITADINGDNKDELLYVRYQNTASGRVEVHTWNPGYKSWASHLATNVSVFDPNTREVISGNTAGNEVDELMYVRYIGTASGRVEVHTWDPGYKSWASNIATNLSAYDPTL